MLPPILARGGFAQANSWGITREAWAAFSELVESVGGVEHGCAVKKENIAV